MGIADTSLHIRRATLFAIPKAVVVEILRIDSADSSEMSVALNCNGEYATATHPGASVGNPAGRAAKSKAEQEAANQEQQELESPVTPDE